MTAQKISVAFEAQTLHIDSVHYLIQKALNEIRNENESGNLQANDGDEVSWSTLREDVEI